MKPYSITINGRVHQCQFADDWQAWGFVFDQTSNHPIKVHIHRG